MYMRGSTKYIFLYWKFVNFLFSEYTFADFYLSQIVLLFTADSHRKTCVAREES